MMKFEMVPQNGRVGGFKTGEAVNGEELQKKKVRLQIDSSSRV